jgi:hypothetical protein
MCAILLLKDILNGLIKKDIHRLIGRQASFNDEEFGKRKINTWEIKELDFESATSGKTLRDFIMTTPCQDNPSRKLFHSVDNLRTNRSTIVVTCMPAVESKARNMVSSLLTYLKQQHGDQVLEFFSKDAQIQAIDSYWDEKAQCVQNKDDAHVAGLLNGIDDDYILPLVHKDNQPSQNTPAPVRPQPITPPYSLQRNNFGDDNDSISTFRRDRSAQDTNTVASDDSSSSTIASLTSRLTVLEDLLKAHNIAPPTTSPPSSVNAEGLVNTGGPNGERTPSGNG